MGFVAAAVDLDPLWEAAAAAILAGLAITAAFAIAVFGWARFEESRQARRGVAVVWAAVGVVALGVAVAGVIVALVLMSSH